MPAISVDSATLALGAGLVAALNPCGFALLPVYLSVFVLDQQPPTRVAVGRALRATGAMTAGFAGVFALFGVAIAPIAGSVQQYLPWFTVVLGLVIVAAGIWALAGRRLPGLRIGRLGVPLGGRPVTARVWSMVGFGASYAIVSLGCTIAPFLAVVVIAFRGGSPIEGMALFLAYAAGMGLVVGTAALAVALAHAGLIRTMRRAGPALTRAGGALLVVAGGYVAWYGAWELRVLGGGASADPVVEAARKLQQWLAEAAQRVGVGGFLIAWLVLAAAGVMWRAHCRNMNMSALTDDRNSGNTTRSHPQEEQR